MSPTPTAGLLAAATATCVLGTRALRHRAYRDDMGGHVHGEPNTYGLPQGGPLTAELKKWFKLQWEAIHAAIPDAGPLPTNFPPLTEAQWTDPMARACTPLLAGYWSKSGKDVYGRMGLDPADWEVTNPHLKHAIEAQAFDFCRSTNRSTEGRLGRALTKLKAALHTGLVEEGEALPRLTDRVHAIFAGLTASHAEMIATTEASRAVHAAQDLAAIHSGVVAGFELLLSADACDLCRKIAAECRRVKLGRAFAIVGENPTYAQIKYPPLHPRCVLPETPVVAPVGIAGIKAQYDGPVVRLHLSDGSHITVTPNHMLLTAEGFATAASLVPGEYLVRYRDVEPVRRRHPHDHRMPAPAHQVFEAYAIAPGMAPARVPVAPEDLHGDAALCERDVHVVAAHGLQWHDLDAAASKPAGECPLIRAFDDPFALDRERLLALALFGLRDATDGGVGRLRERKALLRAQSRHPKAIGTGLPPGRDAGRDQSSPDRPAGHAERPREGLLRLPGAVAGDDGGGIEGEAMAERTRGVLAGLKRDAVAAEAVAQSVARDARQLRECFERFPGLITADDLSVKRVERLHYAGPVYDFQTETSLYLVGNGIASSNCQCALTEVLKEEYGGPHDPEWGDTLVQPQKAIGPDGYTPPPGQVVPAPEPDRPRPRIGHGPLAFEDDGPPAPAPAPAPIPPLPPDLSTDVLRTLDLHQVEPSWALPPHPGKRAYGGVIVDDAGRVLLREPKGHFDGYHWTFAKGGQDAGEHPVDTALREVKEETGQDGAILGLVPGGFQGGTSSNYYFLMRSKGQVGPLDHETESVRWATVAEARALIGRTTNAKGRARDLAVLDAAMAQLEALRADPHLNDHLMHPAGPRQDAGEFPAPAPPPPVAPPAPKPKLKPKPKAPSTPQETPAPPTGAVPEPTPAAPPTPAQAASRPDFPTDLAQLEVVKALGGSTGAQLVKDPATGRLYVKKSGGNAGHLLEESHADAAYQALGVAVPKSKVYATASGPVKLAEYHEGRTLADLMRTDPDAAAKAMAEVRKQFVADALLGNWDVVGLSYDNILITPDGRPLRIDNGGSLRYRAQGSKKAAAQWTGTVAEIQTMRAATVNPSAAKVFGPLTDDEVKQQALKLLSKRDALLKAVPEELRATLGARLDYLKGWAEAKAAPKVAGWTPRPESAFRAPFATTQEMEAWGKKAFGGWAGSLTEKEADLVQFYTGSGYTVLNAAIREGRWPGKGATPYFQKLNDQVTELDRILKRAVVPEDITAWRGVKDSAHLGIADPSRLKLGDVIHEAAFASTSLRRETSANFASGGWKPVLLKLLVPKGTRGAYVNAAEDHSSHPGERELLLPPGARYRVVKVGTEGGMPVVTVEVVP